MITDKEFLEIVRKGNIPYDVPRSLEDKGYLCMTNERRQLERETLYGGMCCIITHAWIQELIIELNLEQKVLLEVGAGLGFFAKALREYDITIHATDSMQFKYEYGWNRKQEVTYIEALSSEQAILKYKDIADILVVICPYRDETLGKRGCEIWKNTGKPVLYIGDGAPEGLHAGEEFFSYYTQFEEVCIKTKPIRSFTHERIYLGYFK